MALSLVSRNSRGLGWTMLALKVGAKVAPNQMKCTNGLIRSPRSTANHTLPDALVSRNGLLHTSLAQSRSP